MNFMRNFVILCLILFSLAGCSLSKKTADNGIGQKSDSAVGRKDVIVATSTDILPSNVQPVEEEGQIFYHDIVYAKVAGFGDLKLDLTLPKDASNNLKPLPLVIGIHGGGWRSGSKENCFAEQQLVKLGYATACLDYRLSGTAKFPAQIYDIKAAIRWLRANAADYNLDVNHFGAWGNSAGAHLAVMLGVTGGVKELEGDVGVTGYSSRVQAVVDWYGPVEFSAIIPLKDKYQEYYEAATELIGKSLENSSDLILKASPLNYITADDPPILIMHGAKDGVVPYQQSELLYGALKEKGVRVYYRLYPENDHEFHEEQDYKTVADFFDQYFKN